MSNVDIRRLDFSLLLVFVELYRLRRGTAVARKLGLTQSSISHALSRLRDIFGDELFLRRAHGLEPTARAIALEPGIRALVDLAGEMIVPDRGFDPSVASDMLRIGGSDYACAVFGPPLVERLRRAAPGMTLLLRPFTRRAAAQALAAGELDVAIGYFWDVAPTLHVEPLFEETYSVLMRDGHRLIGELTPEAFAAADHMLVSYEGDTQGIVDSALESHGLKRRVVATVPFFFAAMAMVRSTDLIATIPRRLAAAYAAGFGLTALPPPIAIRPFPVALAWDKRTLRSRLRDWLIEEIRAVVRVAGAD